MVSAALVSAKAKKELPGARRGCGSPASRRAPSAQVMHIGPYSAEGPTILGLHEFIRGSGRELRGKHHEIYLSDPRRAAPEKLRTIIRQPVGRRGRGRLEHRADSSCDRPGDEGEGRRHDGDVEEHHDPVGSHEQQDGPRHPGPICDVGHASPPADGALIAPALQVAPAERGPTGSSRAQARAVPAAPGPTRSCPAHRVAQSCRGAGQDTCSS